jgi:crossover junction endodeoxyribonuclease RusA
VTPRGTFWVDGLPQTQGSARAFVCNGRAIVTSTNKALKPWRAAVAETAIANGWTGAELLDGPVAVSTVFVLQRLASHFGAKGLKASAPAFPHTSGGDLDKLERAIFDALTGLVYRDDRRVVCSRACRLWGPRVGALISVAPFFGERVGAFDFTPSAAGLLALQAEEQRGLWPLGTDAELFEHAPKISASGETVGVPAVA